MSVGEKERLKAASDRIWVRKSRQDLSLSQVLLLALAISINVAVLDCSHSRSVVALTMLTIDPVGELVKDFLAKGQLFACEELGHLVVDEVASVNKTALVLSIITTRKDSDKAGRVGLLTTYTQDLRIPLDFEAQYTRKLSLLYLGR